MHYFYFMVQGIIHCWAVDGYDESLFAFRELCRCAIDLEPYSFNYQINKEPSTSDCSSIHSHSY